MTTNDTCTRPTWVTLAVVVLAGVNSITGAWAVITPQKWFDTFPGWTPRLVAAFPPYNEHLATDAGAGLLTVGVLAGCALVIDRRDVVLTAMVGVLAFSTPHALFHLTSPADASSTAENAVNSLPLVGAVALAAAVFAHTWRQR